MGISVFRPYCQQELHILVSNYRTRTYHIEIRSIYTVAHSHLDDNVENLRN